MFKVNKLPGVSFHIKTQKFPEKSRHAFFLKNFPEQDEAVHLSGTFDSK